MLLVLLLILPGLKTEEVTPSNLIVPTTSKYLQFEPVKFLKRPKPTKQGPILFPSDGPTPPPTPLIVTSRPLIESIRRSELNPNNTIQASSQVNQVALTPEYLRERGIGEKSWIPYSYLQNTPDHKFQNVPYQVVPIHKPKPIAIYDDTAPDYTTFYLNKLSDGDPNKYYTQQTSTLPPIYRMFANQANPVFSQQNNLAASPSTRPVYEYQQTSTLPPIYRTFANQANPVFSQQNNLAASPSTRPVNEYQKSVGDYTNYNPNRGSVVQNNNVQNYGDNYAFSYTVKDHQTGDDFSHSQSSKGSATNGEYRVRLPDGRMQIVSYTADEGGYKAEVRYDDDHTGNEDNSNPVTAKQNNEYNNRYINNNRYTVDNSKVTNNNGNTNSYENVNGDNLYFDYLDKTREGDTVKYNNNFLDNSRHNIYDKVYNKEDFSSELYSEQTSEPKANDYDHYPDDASTEHKDYSIENINYGPYKSKYTAYLKTNEPVKSTVVPPYKELKNIFVTQNPQFALSTGKQFESTTENVVVIGTKKPGLFTNIRNLFNDNSISPTPIAYTTVAPADSSPSNYLISTITNLKNKLNLSDKPILSQAYVNKINKYLDFKF